MQVAEALEIPRSFTATPSSVEQASSRTSSAQNASSLQSLLELRLLRAFSELSDHRTKRMLVHLAEQIVKRQANRRGDAG